MIFSQKFVKDKLKEFADATKFLYDSEELTRIVKE
jgi:hypothetical protein